MIISSRLNVAILSAPQNCVRLGWKIMSLNDCKFIPARSESVISDSEMTVYCQERDVSSDDNSSASTPTTTYFQDVLDDKKELHIVEIPDIVTIPSLYGIHRTSPN